MSARAPVPLADEAGGSQAVKAQLRLREMILAGELPGGSRIAELAIVEKLGVSRTPIRSALMRLEQEGLLEALPNGGYAVRTFSERDVSDAIELRGTMEGLAARLAAENGLTDDLRQLMERALAEGDRALARRSDKEAQRAAYARTNELFHSTIHEAARSDLVTDVVRLCQRVPQASAYNVVAFDLADVRERHRMHHHIYDAILSREPHKAETLMRQHVLAVKISMVRSIARRTMQKRVPDQS